MNEPCANFDLLIGLAFPFRLDRTVNDQLPTVLFGPAGVSGNSSYAIDPTVPLQFSFMGPQLTGPQTTYTYYVSLDGGAYTSSSSPIYMLFHGVVADGQILDVFACPGLVDGFADVATVRTDCERMLGSHRQRPPQCRFGNIQRFAPAGKRFTE